MTTPTEYSNPKATRWEARQRLVEAFASIFHRKIKIKIAFSEDVLKVPRSFLVGHEECLMHDEFYLSAWGVTNRYSVVNDFGREVILVRQIDVDESMRDIPLGATIITFQGPGADVLTADGFNVGDTVNAGGSKYIVTGVDGNSLTVKPA